MKRTLFVLALVLVLPACYHATIDTGMTPGSDTIEQNWASGWVYGLVPPATVDAMSECSNGVARVETVHSFPNMLVQALTFGIYTPMTIKVTCAAGGMEEQEEAVVQDRESFEDALGSGEPFLVRTR